MSFVNIGTLRGFLVLEDQFTPKLTTAIRTLAQSGSKFQKLGTQMQSVGATLTTSLTLPIAGVATGATMLASKFEASMNQVRAVLAPTARELQALEGAALKMG